MASAVADGEGRSVSIGRVFARAFGTIGSNPVATLGIAFLLGAMPSLLVTYVARNMEPQAYMTLGPAGAAGTGVFSALFAILLAMITQGALVRATVAFSEGRKSSLGESAMAGLRVALPLFLLGLLSAVGMALGLILLIVPGVLLYLIWSVAAPALVEERLGPIEALGRSRRLTKGARWTVFGMTLVVLIAYAMFSALVGALSVTWYGNTIEIAANDLGGIQSSTLLIEGISGTLTSAVWGVVQTSLYVELRNWKDGPQAETLADIFR
jgi:uncharacterized membrane protein